MNKESKFKLERIIDQAVKEAYEIGFEDGRAFQGDLITHGIGDVAEALVDIYKKEGREKARKTGEWIARPDWTYECSECGYSVPNHGTKFCPDCGARMNGGGEE